MTHFSPRITALCVLWAIGFCLPIGAFCLDMYLAHVSASLRVSGALGDFLIVAGAVICIIAIVSSSLPYSVKFLLSVLSVVFIIVVIMMIAVVSFFLGFVALRE